MKPPLENNTTDSSKLADEKWRVIRLKARWLSAMIIVLIFSLSVFGRIIADKFSFLKTLAPALGIVIFLVLLFFLRRDTYQSAPRQRRDARRIIKKNLITICTIIICLFITELLIVDEIERIHFVKYALLTAALFVSQSRASVKKRAFAAMVLAISIGAFDESVQFFVPHRVFDLRDLSLNLVGSLFGVIIIWLCYLWQRDS